MQGISPLRVQKHASVEMTLGKNGSKTDIKEGARKLQAISACRVRSVLTAEKRAVQGSPSVFDGSVLCVRDQENAKADAEMRSLYAVRKENERFRRGVYFAYVTEKTRRLTPKCEVYMPSD